MKGIKREFSVARTPQQNGIDERKNMTLIEAARTMLTYSLLPFPFWAEAVNTACYVQNRVLVTKPHNKTPYVLLLGRTPSIGFMRSFGYPVTILNTLDPLGKFDGKAGSGPTWLFDIDTLTKFMNYQPVPADNQPNPSAGIQEHFDADKARKENEPEFEVKELESTVHVSPSSSAKTKKHDNMTNREAKGEIPAVGQISTNNTNTFSAAGPYNTAVSPTLRKYSYVDPSQYPDDPNMPALEDITYSDDEADVGAEADFTNLETNITVSPILTGDLSSAPQTRSMTRMVKEQGGLTQINNDDFHTCMFVCFFSQEEPKRVHQSLKDPSWIEAMQEELLQFKMQTVWVLVDLPKGKRAIGSKWEEGIDYEEVFALVVRIEAIRLFLAYASFMGFMVYQIDVKSTFLYETIEEEVYIDDIIFGSTNKDLCKDFKKLMKDKFQMSSMGELTFFLGLQVKQKHDWIFISQDKYVAEILRKFGLIDRKSASTPIDTKKPLLKDSDGEDVDVHTYRLMIGSLMYLTSSRPDIMFAFYACAHFYVTPKASHLHTVKRIFRYLKGKLHLGLWYLKDSPFNLVAYSDSDYAGASLDRESIIGGCQFLGCRLISWQCKKQTVVATSSTEAEYVHAASCCAQVLWIQNYPDQTVSGKDSSNPLMADNLPKIVWCSTHHVTLMKSWIVQKQTTLGYQVSAVGFLIYTLLIKKVNDVIRLQALIDTQKVIITEDTVRQALHLDDAKSIDCFPNEEIFTELVRMGYEKPSTKQAQDDDVDDVIAEDAIEPNSSSPKPTIKPPPPQELLPSTSQGRQEESQAQVYHIDLEHADKALSMQDDEPKPVELKEVIEVVTTAKLMTEVVTTAATTITDAPSATRRRKGVVIRDLEETATPSTIVHSKLKSKDKGKGILVEEPKPFKKQAQIEQDEAYARELEAEINKNINWDDVIELQEYTLRDYYCWLKTYCCWYKLKLLDKTADLRLRLLEESAAANDKMKK
nr:uncharacterized mitochondrial protein AtMg00810-like [Tanacetum cinerariifolium]